MVCILHKKQFCRECNHGYCEHGKQKTHCRECGGSSFCEHGKQKHKCRECGGSAFCEHGKYKQFCRECGGSSICEHGKLKFQCRECSPEGYFTQVIRCSVHRVFNASNLPKNESYEYYLGCSIADFKTYLVSKMTKEMTIDNVHIDHIKPLTCFNLDDLDELKRCCHYTNLQPLLARDNLALGNKWTDENEAFWNKNIIYNSDFLLIYKN